ncbi:putative holin [Xanthomonas sp. 60]
MTEPTSTGSLTALATSVGLASLLPGIDGDALIGAFAGATLFVVSAKNLPLWKRLIYLVISVVAGYLGNGEVMGLFKLQSAGLASFLCSALAITVTLKMIERSDRGSLPRIRRGDPNV